MKIAAPFAPMIAASAAPMGTVVLTVSAPDPPEPVPDPLPDPPLFPLALEPLPVFPPADELPLPAAELPGPLPAPEESLLPDDPDPPL